MKIARWYYVNDPDLPQANGAGTPFHHPKMYAEIARVVKENPGLTGSEIAALVGKSREYVSPLLFHLKKYGGALRTEITGFYRTPGLDEFRQIQAVQKMLSKLGSEKTKGPWTRRLFRYEQWLKEKGCFGSITEALQDYKGAKDEDARYRHVDLIQEYLNSWRADRDTKDSILTVIRGFYRKNRADLPREKVVYNKDMLLNGPSAAEEYVKPEEIWKIINDGSVPIRDKAILAVLLYMGLDESTLATQFNYYAYPQLAKALGERFEDWDAERGPVRINLIRPKTMTKYYNFLPRRGLELVKDWLNVRREITGSVIGIRRESDGEVSDPGSLSALPFKDCYDDHDRLGLFVYRNPWMLVELVERRMVEDVSPYFMSYARSRLEPPSFMITQEAIPYYIHLPVAKTSDFLTSIGNRAPYSSEIGAGTVEGATMKKEARGARVLRLAKVPEIQEPLDEKDTERLSMLPSTEVRGFEVLFQGGATQILLSSRTECDMKEYLNAIESVYGVMDVAEAPAKPDFLQQLPLEVGLLDPAPH